MPVGGGYWLPTEAVGQLGVSVRTVERLVAASHERRSTGMTRGVAARISDDNSASYPPVGFESWAAVAHRFDLTGPSAEQPLTY
jgi:hypothetical protein